MPVLPLAETRGKWGEPWSRPFPAGEYAKADDPLNRRQCDGKRPSCSQCVARNRRCPGYRADLIFVSPETASGCRFKTAGAHKRARSSAGSRRSAGSPSSPDGALARPLSWPVCDVVSLCALNFIPAGELPYVSDLAPTSLSRICGAWVGVLPSLLGTPDEHVLSPAIRALALSIVARGHDGRAPISDALEARCVALRVLHTTISHVSDRSFNSLAAAMMCLYMSEVTAHCSVTTPLFPLWGVKPVLRWFSSGLAADHA